LEGLMGRCYMTGFDAVG